MATKPIDYYLKEIGKAQTGWNDYKGNQPLQQGFHQQAEKLRGEARQSGYDLSSYGHDMRSYYNTPQQPQQQTQPQQQQGSPYDGIISGLLNGGSQLDTNSMWKQAYGLADNQYSKLNSQIQSQIGRLQSERDVALGRVNTNKDFAEQDLKDESFQEYLRSRQSLANSGLSGQPMATDENIRLDMNRNKALERLNRQVDDQRFGIESQYGSNLGTLEDKLSSFNAEEIANKAFQDIYSNALKGQENQQNTMFKIMDFLAGREDRGTISAYEQARLGLDTQRLGLDTQKMIQDREMREFEHINPTGTSILNNQTELQKQANELGWREYDKNNVTADTLAQIQGNIQTAGIRAAGSGSGDGMNNSDMLRMISAYGSANPLEKILLESMYPGLKDANALAIQNELALALEGISPENSTLEDALAVVRQMPMAAGDRLEVEKKLKEEWAKYSKNNPPKDGFWKSILSGDMGYNMGVNGVGVLTTSPSSGAQNQSNSGNAILDWLSNMGYNMGANGVGK